MKKTMMNEIALGKKDVALKIIDLLVEEDYVVMLSKEENFYIVSFEYSENSDRNGVVFMSIDEFEQNYMSVENLSEENYDILTNP